MSDIEMLELFFNCFFLFNGCQNCKLFDDKECEVTRRKWLTDYIQRLKNREDDLK